jgi:hypothetical protein
MKDNQDPPAAHVITVPRLELRHLLYMALCLAGAAAALCLFWRNLNLTLERFGDEPVGTVTRKQNTVQRRFADRVLWDRLRGQSPVYSGDYIRTAELSAAELSLSGGEFVSLGEHSLIQILRTAEGFTLELAEGALEADTGGGALVVRAAGASLRAEGGSVFSAALPEAGELEAGVIEGSAVFSQGDRTLLLNAGEGRFLQRSPALPGPPSGVSPRLISPVEEAFDFSTTRPGVRFLWSSVEGALSYWLEISSRSDMSAPFHQSRVGDTGGETCSIVYSGFEPGTWYWRVRPEYGRNSGGAASAAASFTVSRTEGLAAPVQQFPLGQGSLYVEDSGNGAYFSWKQEADAVSYTFLLSRYEDLNDPLVRQTVRDNYFVYDMKRGKLEPGEYYWGVYQTDAAGNRSAASAARAVVIIAGPPPAAGAERLTGAAPAAPPAAPREAGPAAAAPAAQAPAAVPAAPPAAPRDAGPAAATPSAQAPAAVPAAPEALPPLPAPGNMRPASGYVLTEAIIVRDKQIAFSWNAVPGASSYVFTLYQAEPNGGRREILRLARNDTAFTLTDLAVLDRGTFIWRVEPVSRTPGQDGNAGENRFTVSIEETTASQGRESGVMFGTD